jgi:hypothetical protein
MKAEILARTAAKGHEEQFSPPTLSARYVIRQETFAGTRGNVRGAPKNEPARAGGERRSRSGHFFGVMCASA